MNTSRIMFEVTAFLCEHSPVKNPDDNTSIAVKLISQFKKEIEAIRLSWRCYEGSQHSSLFANFYDRTVENAQKKLEDHFSRVLAGYGVTISPVSQAGVDDLCFTLSFGIGRSLFISSEGRPTPEGCRASAVH